MKNSNIKFDRFFVFSSKQQKCEPVESFYGKIIEQAENCSLRDAKKTVIRETFFLNVLDYETQTELHKETLSQPKSLEIAIHMGMGAQNQQKIDQNLDNNNTQSLK